MVLLIVKDWILKEIVNAEEEKKETAKDNWHYRLTSATWNYTLIDYDKDLARPYVKALLAKVNKLKEVKMLWAVLFLILFTYLTFFALFFIQYFRISDLQKLISDIPKVNNANIQKQQSSISQNNNYFDTLWGTPAKTNEITNTWSNKLFR